MSEETGMGRSEVAVASAVYGAPTGRLRIADQEFESRLFVGTGKYPDNETMVEAIRASGTAMVTVAVRRVDLDRTHSEGILFHLDPEEFFLLPNTAGCYTAEDAIRYARLARAAGFNEWLKLEVIGDETTLVPDTQATLEAAETLVAEGFNVMAYTNDDLVTALHLGSIGGWLRGGGVGLRHVLPGSWRCAELSMQPWSVRGDPNSFRVGHGGDDVARVDGGYDRLRTALPDLWVVVPQEVRR